MTVKKTITTYSVGKDEIVKKRIRTKNLDFKNLENLTFTYDKTLHGSTDKLNDCYLLFGDYGIWTNLNSLTLCNHIDSDSLHKKQVVDFLKKLLVDIDLITNTIFKQEAIELINNIIDSSEVNDNIEVTETIEQQSPATNEVAHAKLSASGSSMWLNCPGSVKAQENIPNQPSLYSEEGSLAHAIADLCLKNNDDCTKHLGKSLQELNLSFKNIPADHLISEEMCAYVQSYVDYVRSFQNKKSESFYEMRVDYSHIAPEGFGTCDAIILDPDNKTMHIIDLKYGKGVFVDVYENTQLQLYASGANNLFGMLDIYDKITLHIVMPRLNYYGSWELTLNELAKFEEYAKKQAESACSDDAERIPGEKQCQWCLAKHNCKALDNFVNKVITPADFEDFVTPVEKATTSLSMADDEIRNFLDAEKLILSKLKAAREYAENKLLAGEFFPGYKLVEGTSRLKWKDDAPGILEKEYGRDKIYKTIEKFITLTEAKKELGKKVVEQYSYKPPAGKIMVKESDVRPGVVVTTVDDFDCFDESGGFDE
jgi:hypothetical protein